MTELSSLPQTIRVGFRITTELSALSKLFADFGLRENRKLESKDLLIWEFISSNPDYQGSVVVSSFLDVKGLACAYISGSGRADLSFKLGDILHYLPTYLFHLMARATSLNLKIIGIRLLGQLYLAGMGGCYWDDEMEASIRPAQQHPDRWVKHYALMTEKYAQPPHKRKADEAISQNAELTPLEPESAADTVASLMGADSDISERPHVSKEAPSSDLKEIPQIPIALPFYVDLEIDKMVEQFDTFDRQTEELRTKDGHSAKMVRFRPAETSNSWATFLVVESLKFGCAYFDGEHAETMVRSYSSHIDFYPTHILKLVSRFSAHPDWRAMALSGLGLTILDGIIPGLVRDPAIARLIDDASKSTDHDLNAASKPLLSWLDHRRKIPSKK